MNYLIDQQTMYLLNGTGKAAPEITSGLSQLGDGRMADGLIALWKNGQRNGFIRGTIGTMLFFVIGMGLAVLIKNKIVEVRTQKEILASFSTATTKSAGAEASINTEPEIIDNTNNDPAKGE